MMLTMCWAAVGCANLDPPVDAWVERSGDRTTVSCNKTSQSWHLVCKGTTWVGPQTHDCRHGLFACRRFYVRPPDYLVSIICCPPLLLHRVLAGGLRGRGYWQDAGFLLTYRRQGRKTAWALQLFRHNSTKNMEKVDDVSDPQGCLKVIEILRLDRMWWVVKSTNGARISYLFSHFIFHVAKLEKRHWTVSVVLFFFCR